MRRWESWRVCTAAIDTTRLRRNTNGQRSAIVKECGSFGNVRGLNNEKMNYRKRKVSLKLCEENIHD